MQKLSKCIIKNNKNINFKLINEIKKIEQQLPTQQKAASGANYDILSPFANDKIFKTFSQFTTDSASGLVK